ncbi:hypothetical protein BC829DRAFT_414002 [Chytridium lagenaria]|nr:hypothetical protein BC829DRAFT_414002 [Chytridium lagenaria]
MQVEPAYYFEENGVPVFTPTYKEFKNFSAYMNAVEPYGRVSGIVKIIPPKEWRDRVPDITPALRKIQIRSAITQEIKGGGLPPGMYRQVNVENRRVYTVQNWFDLAESSQHRPPIFDSEGRASHVNIPPKRKRSRPQPTHAYQLSDDPKEYASAVFKDTVDDSVNMECDQEEDVDLDAETMTDSKGGVVLDTPSPISVFDEMKNQGEKENSFATKDLIPKLEEEAPDSEGFPEECHEEQVKQPRKRKRFNPEGEDLNFDIRKLSSGFSLDYCKEVERFYWKISPMSWNLNRLDNVLSRLDANLPGVNKPYLYFGMWKASFAWHVEDMDLYSINFRLLSNGMWCQQLIKGDLSSLPNRFSRMKNALSFFATKPMSCHLEHLPATLSLSIDWCNMQER